MHYVKAKGILSSQNGIMHNNDEIFAYLHRFEEKPPYEQLSITGF